MKKKNKKKISVYTRDLWDNSHLIDELEFKQYLKEKKAKNKKYTFYQWKHLKEPRKKMIIEIKDILKELDRKIKIEKEVNKITEWV